MAARFENPCSSRSLVTVRTLKDTVHLSPKKPVILLPGCLGSVPRAESYHRVTSGQSNCPRGLGLGQIGVYSAISSVMTKNFWLEQWKVKTD